MTNPTLSTDNGTYEVVKILSRPGGATDLIVSYVPRPRRHRKTTYAAYRHEADGSWKCLNGGWLSAAEAVVKAAHVDAYRPLVDGDLRQFLAGVIGVSEPPVRGGPEIGPSAEYDYLRERET
ncbi:hypothetical protein [Nonomuraea typhae]|uniref:Uncharacterized protein n=1 Tax=Nonomuraea typhae TaxID=2603600 RepID=A0ABW7YLX6_9ACTN